MPIAPKKRGVFLSIEGGEGAGKTTQIQLLLQACEAAGVQALHTREPGGTDNAEAVRALLVQGEAEKWDAVAETLLFLAARREHVSKKILPALADGALVICDRFLDSTRVYQGIAKGLGDDYIQSLHCLTLGNFLPDLTFWLDLPAAKGLARTQNRGDMREMRFEAMGQSFHEKVRSGFAAIAHAEPARFIRLNASQSAQDLHAQMIAQLNARLGLALPVISFAL